MNNKFHQWIRNLCIGIALILSHVMCVVIAYRIGGWDLLVNSAPAEVNLIYAIPFGLGVFLCLGGAWYFDRKAKQG